MTQSILCRWCVWITRSITTVILLVLMYTIFQNQYNPCNKTGITSAITPSAIMTYCKLDEFSLTLDEVEQAKASVNDYLHMLQQIEFNDDFYLSRLVTLMSDKITREMRYVKDEPYTKIIVWSWHGGDSVRQDQLKQTIYAVIERLPMIPNEESLVDLLLETCATESHRGKYVQQMHGPAIGIYQMEPNTLHDTLDWLKHNHIDIYTSVQQFYEKSQTLEWNYKHNVPWQTALAVSYYWRMCGDTLVNITIDLPARAAVYKRWWNTIAGAASIDKYLRDCEIYLS